MMVLHGQPIRFIAADGTLLLIISEEGICPNPTLSLAELREKLGSCITNVLCSLEQRALEAEAEVARLKQFMH